MTLELGLQLYSVRDELAKDFIGTLENIASIGYENLELFFHNDNYIEESVGNLKAYELKKELDRLNLNAVSAHITTNFLNSEKAGNMIKFAKTVGFQSLGIAIAFFKNKQDVLDLCNQMNQAGKLYYENGLQLYYHNHFQEFQKFDGQYVMDIILENTDEKLVKVEYDAYWALRAGVDPIEYLSILGDRCDLLHQKDMPATVDPVNVFEIIGEDADINMELMAKLDIKNDFIEVGHGVMDIEGIMETFSNNPKAKYVFIEQDWTSKNQLESVKNSYHYISNFLKNK